ncbi:MAG: sensor histidine kinase [Anaerolineae bacterium]
MRAANQTLRQLSRQLVEVQETERRALARELHDEIGQSLTGLKLMLDIAAASQAGEPAGSLAEMQEMVSRLISQVRELSLNLRPSMLDDLGLLPTLLWYIERYQRQTGIEVKFRHSRLNRRFSPALETAAYRITQEALTNVARHAGVKRAALEIRAASTMLELKISDAGVGFEPADNLSRFTGGITGMTERAALLDGSLKLKSEPGQGVAILVALPFSAAPEPAK